MEVGGGGGLRTKEDSSEVRQVGSLENQQGGIEFTC